MALNPVSAVLIHVADPAAALRWYQRALPTATHGRIESHDFDYLSIDGVRLEFVPADAKVGSGAAGSVVYWCVDDFDAARARLEAVGATLYRGPMAIEDNKQMGQWRDPWGNCIGLRGPSPKASSAPASPRRLPDQIETPRLFLRRPSEKDAQAIFVAYAQDAHVCQYMIWSPHRELAETERFITGCSIAWEAGNRMAYVLTERESDQAIGMLEARVQGSTVDIGYVLAQALWGRGLMPEAIQALASTALAQPRLFRVQATCDVTNTASARALEKAGFAREGRLERHTIHPNLSPEPRACFMYARVREQDADA